jgi:hypothetical protein
MFAGFREGLWEDRLVDWSERRSVGALKGSGRGRGVGE